MIPLHLTADKASEWAGWLWSALLVVWVLLWAGMKRAKKLESPSEMLQHALPVVLGFWLLFGRFEHWGWLDYRMCPQPGLPASRSHHSALASASGPGLHSARTGAVW